MDIYQEYRDKNRGKNEENTLIYFDNVGRWKPVSKNNKRTTPKNNSKTPTNNIHISYINNRY